MLTSQQPVFRKFWHATVPLSSLQGEAPQPFTLLGEKIVLFLDESGAPAALKDRCCHRTAKLSKGRCINGRLECGYHGWTYNGGGKVANIERTDGGKQIRIHRIGGKEHLCSRYAGGREAPSRLGPDHSEGADPGVEPALEQTARDTPEPGALRVG